MSRLAGWRFDLNSVDWAKKKKEVQLASVVQLDVCLTGDQEVAVSTLPCWATFFCGDWS